MFRNLMAKVAAWFVGRAADDEDEGGKLEQGVTSSHLVHVVWDEEDGETLYITFRNGSTYSWPGTTRATYEGLVNAESAGKYFWANIRGR